MDLALAFDASYAPHAHTVIESLLHHHPSPIRFWLLPGADVSGDAKRRLERHVGSRGTVNFLENNDLDVDSLPLSSDAEFNYVSSASYLRLMLPYLVPTEVERLLYLDCDILCLGGLGELFDVDLRGNTAAAVRDPHARRLCDFNGMPGLARYPELDPQAPYYNCGVLLIDVPAWLREEITPKSLDYIRANADETRFLEQDALNYALHGKWLRVDKKWNHCLTHRLESAVGGAFDDATLLHQIGPHKLWSPGFPDGDRKSLYDAFAGQARAAIEASEVSQPPGEPKAAATRFPLSPAQELWCAGEEAGAFEPRFVMADALRISGHVEVSALQHALDDVVVRHEILRTTVERAAATPYQEVHPPSPVPLELRDVAEADERARDRIVGELLIEAESAELPVDELPLLRAVLVRFDDQDSALALVTHHSAGDGWSMGLLKRDLAACYTARLSGTPVDLPEASQYGEFAVSLRESRRGGSADAAREYWRERLRGARRFALPADRPVSEIGGSPYSAHNFIIEADLMRAVSGLAAETRGSVFIVLLATFNVLANRITGTTDPAVNALTAGRGDRRFHHTMGPFLNFLTLRTDIGACASFREVVTATRNTLFGAYAHELPIQDVEQELPDLQAALLNPRNCDFIFGFTRPNPGAEDFTIGESSAPVRQLEQRSADIPGGAAWTMAMEPSGETFGKVQFNPDEFDESTVADWVSDYLFLLAHMTKEPTRDWRFR